MDPLTHTLLTRRLIGKRPAVVLVGGIVPDLPFYLTYPPWVAAQGKVRYALASNDWPDPPQWMEALHHAFHSLPVLLVAGLIVRLVWGRWPRAILWAWMLHILVDIPTHSRRHWGPRFLWPCSDFVLDGVSWGNVATLAFARLMNWGGKKGRHMRWRARHTNSFDRA